MPFTLPFTATEITAFKDFTIACAAIATPTIAYIGLKQWKSETTFKAKFELSREVVEATYKISNAIDRLRKTRFDLGGVDGLDNIRKNQFKDLIDLHDHYLTLAVQVKALLSNEHHLHTNGVTMTSGGVIRDFAHLIDLRLELYINESDIEEVHVDMENGESVGKAYLDSLTTRYSDKYLVYTDLLKSLSSSYDKGSKSDRERSLDDLINTAVNEMVDSLNIYLKAK